MATDNQALFDERLKLVQLKLAGTITEEQSKRLAEVREDLDRIELIQEGEFLEGDIESLQNLLSRMSPSNLGWVSLVQRLERQKMRLQGNQEHRAKLALEKIASRQVQMDPDIAASIHENLWKLYAR